MKLIIAFLLSSILINPGINITTIEFPSKDELTITADLYERNPSDSYLLLCHQAGFSRGEYKETAKQFISLGYNCMAIDQRSGKEINGIKNETAARAQEKGLATNYIDAKQDIEAALDYLYKKSQKPVILVGSSYSASLALMIAKKNIKVAGVLAFSPGEYLKEIKVKNEISGLQKKVFITSSKAEIQQTTQVTELAVAKTLKQFKPNGEGIHGSRALWKSTPDQKEYWEAVAGFLRGINR